MLILLSKYDLIRHVLVYFNINIERERADRHVGKSQNVYIDSTAVQNSGETIDFSSRPDVTSN